MSGGSVIGNQGLISSVIDFVGNGVRATILDWPRFGDINESIVDTTNLANATYYYPSSVGFSTLGCNERISVTGKLICAAGTVTLTCEATNDEDLAAGDWIDVTQLLCDQTDTSGTASFAAAAGTTTFALFTYEGVPYANYRWKIVVDVAASGNNTVIIKQVKKSK